MLDGVEMSENIIDVKCVTALKTTNHVTAKIFIAFESMV